MEEVAITVIEASDGTERQDENWSNFMGFSRGQRGCHASHSKALHLVAKSTAPLSLILEDDAIPLFKKGKLFESISNLGMQMDEMGAGYLQVGLQSNKLFLSSASYFFQMLRLFGQSIKSLLIGKRPLISPYALQTGTFGYLITKEMAQQLSEVLNGEFQMIAPIDEFFLLQNSMRPLIFQRSVNKIFTHPKPADKEFRSSTAGA
jgi:GR25 family glycosyltransferase involved in LPS biosynthesis